MVQQRLLEVAIREFGRKGLEGASTRGIAQAAGTAMSSITYHYGGKEKLYQAAAGYIAETLCEQFAPLLAEANDVGDDSVASRAAIHRLLGEMVERMGASASADWAMFIVREQLDPTPAFETLYAGMLGRMLERLAALVCIASGNRSEDDARIVAITLMGQVLALRSSRGSCLKMLRKSEIDAEARAALRRRIAANTDAILDQLAEEA